MFLGIISDDSISCFFLLKFLQIVVMYAFICF